MIPIFLWSTVLTQARQPGLGPGPGEDAQRVLRDRRPPEGRASASVGRSTIAMDCYSSVSR